MEEFLPATENFCREKYFVPLRTLSANNFAAMRIPATDIQVRDYIQLLAAGKSASLVFQGGKRLMILHQPKLSGCGLLVRNAERRTRR